VPPAELALAASEQMALLDDQHPTASILGQTGKVLGDDTVSAPRQAELREFTDASVLRLAQQGDAVAFERVYRWHGRKVPILCLRMVGNPTDAEDLTQDVFPQLFPRIDTFRGESAVSTWLHRMSVNIVLMRFRKNPIAETSLDTITNPTRKQFDCL
jgi:hypothetical protein